METTLLRLSVDIVYTLTVMGPPAERIFCVAVATTCGAPFGVKMVVFNN